MQIKVRLIGAFRIDRFKENSDDYPAGTTVSEIVDQLQIPRRSVGIVLLNGLHAKLESPLNDGDTLSLLPILGGG